MKNVIEKIMAFRKIVKISLQNISDEEMLRIVDHLVRHQDGSRNYLTENEMIVRDLCLKYGYKPKTLKFNLVFFRYPKHLQDQIINGDISFAKSCELYKNYKQRTDKEVEAEIRELILKSIESLPDYFAGEDNNA